MLDIKQYVLERVEPKIYYKARFTRWNPKVRTNVTCVFHTGDKKPSLSINLRNGGARCFASSCGASIGNIVHFESRLRKISEEEAAKNLYHEFVRPIVPENVWQKFHTELLNDSDLSQELFRATRLNSYSVKQFKIGYDERSARFTFPIESQFGDIINVRFYRLKTAERKSSDVKIYSLVQNKGKDDEIRYGENGLFPWQLLRTYSTAKPLFFMASEKETMLACQLGLQAVCTTGGEGSWREEWLELFEGYEVGVVFDQDAGGRKASEKMIATLQPTAKIVVGLELPFDSDYRGDRDFDDWIISNTGNPHALANLFKAGLLQKSPTLPFSLETRQEKLLDDEWAVPKYFDSNIHDLGEIRARTDFLDHCIQTKGIVAASSSKSFDIPYKFKVKTKSGVINYSMPVSRELISFVGASDDEITHTLSKLVKAEVIEWKADKRISMMEVEIVPIVEVTSDTEGRYITQRCFVLGKIIESNTPYNLTVIPTTLTRSQEKVCIIISADETAAIIDTWTFNETEASILETFKPKNTESVYDKLESLAEEIAVNHTKIFDRPDWHIVALLSWVCPLAWYFPNEKELQRGWLNTLAVGDTQTGKSKVVATLQSLFKLGDIVNAENCTYVGLVGGAIKVGSGQMMLRWGRIPLCDRKLVIIEEFSGLSVEEISRMSEVRSRGIARPRRAGRVARSGFCFRRAALRSVYA